MSEATCTCHCGGSMFYRHLHAESCELSRVGEEAPKSELEKLRDEVARLTKALLYVDYCLAQPGDDETPANQYVPSRAEIESCTRVVQAALTPQGGKGGV